MQIGFAAPVAGSWATAPNLIEVASTAEALGYATLWTFQRLLSPVDEHGEFVLAPPYRSVQDPLATLAFLAGRTSTIRLGVAVLNLPFYAPIVLAKLLTTIDVLSDGRLDVGLGTGWSPDEFEAAGAPMAGRGKRADEYLETLDAIWSGGVVTHAGERYRIAPSRVLPAPVQQPHPPILLGGMSEAALRRAGRAADGWISSSQADLSRIDESIEVVRTAARAAGRDPDALRFVCRGVVKVREGERGPLTGSLDEIRQDLDELATKGVTEVFVDLNFDPEIGSPDVDPDVSMRRACEVLEALAPTRA